jgi:ornithine cyclodeaminase/alanine dehydrogenase-like protein (mu-crystallin family)
MMSVLVLSDADVRSALELGECERAMAAALIAYSRGSAHVPLRFIMRPPEAAGVMALMPAYRSDEATDDPGTFALKAICLMPGNPQRGLDAHQGTVTLFDGETGGPTAILNTSAVTEVRTAAATAAATRALARADSRVLTVLGGSVQARSHLAALAGVRDWEQIRAYAPTREHAQALTAVVPELVVAGSAREAVAGADVVVTVTSSRRPVLEHEWLAPGAHVNAVGASTPDAWEVPVATVAAAALFCDSRESLRNEAGEFREAIAEGAIGGDEHVRAEIGEVLAGDAQGRRDDAELTLFRSLGIAVEDLAAARVAVARARELGIGTEVEL